MPRRKTGVGLRGKIEIDAAKAFFFQRIDHGDGIRRVREQDHGKVLAGGNHPGRHLLVVASGEVDRKLVADANPGHGGERPGQRFAIPGAKPVVLINHRCLLAPDGREVLENDAHLGGGGRPRGDDVGKLGATQRLGPGNRPEQSQVRVLRLAGDLHAGDGSEAIEKQIDALLDRLGRGALGAFGGAFIIVDPQFDLASAQPAVGIFFAYPRPGGVFDVHTRSLEATAQGHDQAQLQRRLRVGAMNESKNVKNQDETKV